MKRFYHITHSSGIEEIVESEKDPEMASLGSDIITRSPGYERKSELIEKERILLEPCKTCGGLVSARFIEPTASMLIAKNICFNCAFWERIISEKDLPNRIVVNHWAYIYLPDNPKPGWGDGFGGREFKIEKDGNVITTHNLWCNGDIPERFWKDLPDNAKFL